jgi:hypothetical protein
MVFIYKSLRIQNRIMVGRNEVRSNKVYRNNKTGLLGVEFSGYDYGVIEESVEVAMVYQGKDKDPSDKAPPFIGTSFENLDTYELKPQDLLTEEHVNNVCKPAKGNITCRYLTIGGRSGFECAKVSGDTSLAHHIDERVKSKEMSARGNNCGGRYNSNIYGSSTTA